MNEIVDAIRHVTACVQNAIAEGKRSRHIDADDLVEVLLAIADQLETDVVMEDDVPLDALAAIAKSELHVPTLESQERDRLDFHDVGVAGLRQALVRAYRLGRESRSS
jgi:hypothetical protein